MVNYKNTIIYKLCCRDLNITEIYVGHTTKFNRRKNAHKSCCNNEKDKQYNTFPYKFIRANGGWDNWAMVKLCDYPCENITQACIQERRAIYRLNASLNSIKPYRSVDEQREYNKEYGKEYRVNNVEKSKEKRKEYYEQNKEQILEKAEEYYQINKEKIKEQKKEYYEQTKEKILEKAKTKVNCPNCNQLLCKSTLLRHMRSNKCQSFKINQTE